MFVWSFVLVWISWFRPRTIYPLGFRCFPSCSGHFDQRLNPRWVQRQLWDDNATRTINVAHCISIFTWNIEVNLIRNNIVGSLWFDGPPPGRHKSNLQKLRMRRSCVKEHSEPNQIRQHPKTKSRKFAFHLKFPAVYWSTNGSPGSPFDIGLVFRQRFLFWMQIAVFTCFYRLAFRSYKSLESVMPVICLNSWLLKWS